MTHPRTGGRHRPRRRRSPLPRLDPAYRSPSSGPTTSGPGRWRRSCASTRPPRSTSASRPRSARSPPTTGTTTRLRATSSAWSRSASSPPGDTACPRARVGTRKHALQPGRRRREAAPARRSPPGSTPTPTASPARRPSSGPGAVASTHRLGPAPARRFTDGQVALFRQMTTGRTGSVHRRRRGRLRQDHRHRRRPRTPSAAQGQNVYGICVAAIAAQALRDAAKVQAGTVTWLTTRIDFATNPLHPARAPRRTTRRLPAPPRPRAGRPRSGAATRSRRWITWSSTRRP